VADRLVVQANVDIGRLTDSVETALRLGKGTILAAILGGQDIVFSEHFACTDCDISIAELEPRNFSFNTPYGACSNCSGLGFRLEIDPELVVPNPGLSIADGALAPWARSGSLTAWGASQIGSLANHYGFSLTTPVKDMSQDLLRILLYGSGADAIEMAHQTQKGKTYRWSATWEGIIPQLERRYIDTESEAVREEIKRYMTQHPCTQCQGLRLKREALAVTVIGMSIIEVSQQSVERALLWVTAAREGEWPDGKVPPERLTQREQAIASQILKEIESRLGFLSRVGLQYLTLDRAASTLSGGEGQRIRLATQIGSGLMGVLYVCDEPSVGLHPVDNHRLIKTLYSLRDVGNTVLIVEHDEAVMRAADHIIDLGPGAGEHGGSVVSAGSLDELSACEESITGAYISGRRSIPVPDTRRSGIGRSLRIERARANNLKGISLESPLGMLVCVTGVSGSGKSSLINDVLYKSLARLLYRAKHRAVAVDSISGIKHVDKVVNIDQSPIGRTPRSNPATYTGTFTPVRDVFAAMPESKARGYKAGRFSFNVKGGRCEPCSGAGFVQIEMQFLPDVTVPCEVCSGSRYNREALEIKFKGKSIADVLGMTVTEAAELFQNIPAVRNKLMTLVDVGLGYIRLGQPATTLSGGEAQRVKLSAELSKRPTGQTLYILDEPTTGLSFEDCNALVSVLHRLVDAKNTVILIEHHLDMIKNADWIIDLGPEAGNNGGELVAQGTPEFIASVGASYTGQYLRELFGIFADMKAPGQVGSAPPAAKTRLDPDGAKPPLSIRDILGLSESSPDLVANQVRNNRGKKRGRFRRRRRVPN